MAASGKAASGKAAGGKAAGGKAAGGKAVKEGGCGGWEYRHVKAPGGKTGGCKKKR
jgi:hypothetical protein